MRIILFFIGLLVLVPILIRWYDAPNSVDAPESLRPPITLAPHTSTSPTVASPKTAVRPKALAPAEVPASLTVPSLPSLDESDTPALAQWNKSFNTDEHTGLRSLLPQRHVVRKLTALLNSVADGLLPTRLTEFARLKPVFKPDKNKGKVVLGTQSYRRYDSLVDALVAVNPKRLVAVYKRWSPLMERAYRELGDSSHLFHSRLLSAMEQLLRVPTQNEPLTLIHMYGHIYRYEDESIEAYNAVAKLLLRSGPRNTQRVQEWVRALKKEL